MIKRGGAEVEVLPDLQDSDRDADGPGRGEWCINPHGHEGLHARSSSNGRPLCRAPITELPDPPIPDIIDIKRTMAIRTKTSRRF